MAMETYVQPDPDYRCPICEASDTEIVIMTMSPPVGVNRPEREVGRSRRCADPACEGHKGVPDPE